VAEAAPEIQMLNQEQQDASSDIYVNEDGRLMLRASSIPADVLNALRTRRKKRTNNVAEEPIPVAPKSILMNVASIITSFFS